METRHGGSRRGARKIPETDPTQLSHSCALDIAEGVAGLGAGDGLTLEEIGDFLGVTRERVRQIEKDGIERLREESVANPDFRSMLTDLAGSVAAKNEASSGGWVFPTPAPPMTRVERKKVRRLRIGVEAGEQPCRRLGCRRPARGVRWAGGRRNDYCSYLCQAMDEGGDGAHVG